MIVIYRKPENKKEVIVSDTHSWCVVMSNKGELI